MPSADTLRPDTERHNRCIGLIVAKLRKYGAIDLARQQIVVHVRFRNPDPSEADTDDDIKAMSVEEIEYMDEGSFALSLSEALPQTGPARRLTKKAAAALRTQTEQRIVIRRDCAGQLPRIAPEELGLICEGVEAFDRN